MLKTPPLEGGLPRLYRVLSCEDSPSGPCLGHPPPPAPLPRLLPPLGQPVATWPLLATPPLPAPTALGGPLDSFFLPCGVSLCSDTLLGSLWIPLCSTEPGRRFPNELVIQLNCVCRWAGGAEGRPHPALKKLLGPILEIPSHIHPPLRHTSPAPPPIWLDRCGVGGGQSPQLLEDREEAFPGKAS